VAFIDIGRGRIVRIDDDDADLLSRFTWYGAKHRNTWYAITQISRRTVYMHRLLMNPPGALSVDHVNGDGLDNRRANLRLATRSEQARNSRKRKSRSRFKGITFHAASGLWMAQIQLPGNKKMARYAKTETEAAYLYNALASEHFGAFARVNDMATGAVS
jgi:hypothetical protein